MTGKLWKHSLRNSVICGKGADPSMLSSSMARRITCRSGWVMGWEITFCTTAPPEGSTTPTYLPQSQRV